MTDVSIKGGCQFTSHRWICRTHPGARNRQCLWTQARFPCQCLRIKTTRNHVTSKNPPHHLNTNTYSWLFAQNPHLLWLSQPSLRGSTLQQTLCRPTFNFFSLLLLNQHHWLSTTPLEFGSGGWDVSWVAPGKTGNLVRFYSGDDLFRERVNSIGRLATVD